MPSLTYDGNYYILKDPYNEAHVNEASGFRWSDDLSVWFTGDPKVAVKYRQFSEGEAEKRLDRLFIREVPWSWPLPDLPKGRELYPHQKEGILWALTRNRSYIRADPGTGKTPIAVMIAASVETKVVYVSPPFLVANVAEEFERWAPGLKTYIYQPRGMPDVSDGDVLIIPDSYLQRDDGMVTTFVRKFIKKPTTIIIDEAQRFSNPDTKRTKTLLGFSPRASANSPGLVDYFYRQVYMSGTPMKNRAMDLYPILSKAAPETIGFRNRFEYGKRYCAGFHTRFGWDFSSSSNMEELSARIKEKFMIRFDKDLLDLPPKIEEVFILSHDMSPRLAKVDSELSNEYGVKDLVKQRVAARDGRKKEDLHVASYRRLLGVEKVPHVAEYALSILAETDESLIIFGFHTEVIKGIAEKLQKYRPIEITGETSYAERHRLVKEFQNSDRRVVVGNYLAMGIGYTLTKATRVIHAEPSWVPGENDQGSDRSHRIGQDKTVYIQYVVYKNSLDKKVIDSLIEKQGHIKHI